MTLVMNILTKRQKSEKLKFKKLNIEQHKMLIVLQRPKFKFKYKILDNRKIESIEEIRTIHFNFLIQMKKFKSALYKFDY